MVDEAAPMERSRAHAAEAEAMMATNFFAAQVHATLALVWATREQTNVLAGIALDSERLRREQTNVIVQAIEGLP